LVEVVQMFAHILDDVLHGDIDRVFNDALVEVSDDVLNDAELLKEFAAGIQDLMGEDVLLAVDPQVGEAFLC